MKEKDKEFKGKEKEKEKEKDYKGKGKNKGSKKDPKPKQEPKVDPKLQEESTAITVMNTDRVTIGTDVTAKRLGVLPYQFDARRMAAASIQSLADNVVNTAINKFVTNRGYQTTVTSSVIFEYVRNSMLAYQLFVQILRAQNASKIKDSKGVSLTIAFLERPVGNSNLGASTHINSGTVLNSVSEVKSISNAVWAQEYLSYLSLIRLPKGIAAYIFAKFIGFFKTTSNVTESYIKFMLNDDVEQSDMYEGYSRVVALLQQAQQNHPDLELILNTIGINSDEVVSGDYTRDLQGQTIYLFEDETIEVVLENSYGLTPNFPFNTDNDTARIIAFKNTLSSIFDTINFTQVPVTMLTEIALHGNRFITSNQYPGFFFNHVYDMRENGNTYAAACFDTEVIVSDVANWDSVAKYQRWVNAASQWRSYTSFELFATPSMTKTLNNAPSYSSPSVIMESAKCWLLPDNDIVEQAIYEECATRLFGLGWRKSLQLQLGSLAQLATKDK